MNTSKEKINEFKKYIESNYEDIITEEIIEIYCMIKHKTNEEKEILKRRFL